MVKKIELEEITEKLRIMYPEQQFDFSNYKNTRSKILAIDPDFGEWNPVVSNLLSKPRKCKKRVDDEKRKSKISVSEIKERIKLKHGNLVTLDDTTYLNTRIKCRFIDKDYGEFFMTPNHVLKGSGHKKRVVRRLTEIKSLDISEVKKRLIDVHGDEIQILEDSYSSLYHRATFIHSQYGEWETIPNNVLKGSGHPEGWLKKCEETCMKKYGVPRAMQNEEVFKKAVTSRWKTITLTHWETNEDIVCMSSYEYAIIRKLNQDQIRYNWQIKIDIWEGTKYYIDLYLIDENLWVEIKGYFLNENNKKKWEVFHERYKNSELWQVDKVTEFTGKNAYQIGKEFKDEWTKIKRRLG